MAEWLGNGLQNRVQQFDSAWYLQQTINPFPTHTGRVFLLNNGDGVIDLRLKHRYRQKPASQVVKSILYFLDLLV